MSHLSIRYPTGLSVDPLEFRHPPFPWVVDACWVKLNRAEPEDGCPGTDVLGDANGSLQPWLLPGLFASWETLGHRLIRHRQLYLFEEIATMLSVAFLSFRCGTQPKIVTF